MERRNDGPMGIASHIRRVSPRVWVYFKSLRYKFYNGEREIWLVRYFLDDYKLALDVGSSIGLYSREMAKYAKKVVAFEANPRVAAFARRVAARNVEVLNVALSSAEGETVLRIPINRRNDTIDDLATTEPKNPLHFGRIASEKVATKRLDDFGFTDCGFIKLDVEGHEEAVLDGAMHLIETQRPIMMIELDDQFNPGTIKRVTERLSGLSYAVYLLFGGRLRPIADFNPDVHQNITAITCLPPHRRRRGEYMKNFIFVPNEAKARIPPQLLSA